MKNKVIKTALAIACISFGVSAKDLPEMDLMMQRLDKSGLTNKSEWESIGEGYKQNIKGGIQFINKSSISSMMTVSGGDENELLMSYTMAGVHCVKSSLEAIDMVQHSTLTSDMYDSITNALKSPSKQAATLVWGYNFGIKITPVSQGLLLSCTLQ